MMMHWNKRKQRRGDTNIACKNKLVRKVQKQKEKQDEISSGWVFRANCELWSMNSDNMQLWVVHVMSANPSRT